MLIRTGRDPLKGILWGYQIPEAFLVIGSQTEKRQESYLRNWLMARDPMAYILSHPVHSAIIPLWKPQTWRTYLRWEPCLSTETTTGMKTKTQAAKFLVMDTFQHVFGDCLEPDGQATFFGQLVPEAFDDIPLLLAQQIVWDLHEMGFCLELQLLDRELNALVDDRDAQTRKEKLADIFPGRIFFPYPTLPDRPFGLAAIDIKDRISSLEAFRRVMVCWRTASREIKNVPELNAEVLDEKLEFMEKKLVKFYVQQFYEASGRAAIFPLRFPTS